MPYLEVVMSLGLIKLESIITHICIWVKDSAGRLYNTQSLLDGFYNILTKFPIIGRYLLSFRTNYPHYTARVNPLKPSYKGVIRNIIAIYPLSVSKFTRIIIPIRNTFILKNTFELNISCRNNFSHLEGLIKKNPLYLRDFISSLASKYGNYICKIHLRCPDQIVTVNAEFKSGHFEYLDVKKNS